MAGKSRKELFALVKKYANTNKDVSGWGRYGIARAKRNKLVAEKFLYQIGVL